MAKGKPMTNAEAVRAHYHRQKAKPLLERLGYPLLETVYPDIPKERAALEKALEKVESRAAALNARMAEVIGSMPEGSAKIWALAELQKSRRVNLKVF